MEIKEDLEEDKVSEVVMETKEGMEDKDMVDKELVVMEAKDSEDVQVDLVAIKVDLVVQDLEEMVGDSVDQD